METANKEQAMVCLRKAEKARDDGDLDKAMRMAEKSLKLYPNDNQKAKDFLSELENCREAGEGRGGGGNEGVRQRQSDGCPEEEEEERGGEGERANHTPEQGEAVESVLRCRDYYEVLGVSRDASEADLKKQYRKLALQLHPDKNRAPKADEAFRAVSNAYGVLSDKDKRKRYDMYGESGVRRSQSGGGASFHRGFHGDLDPEDLFRSFFGDNFHFDDMFMDIPRRRRTHFSYHHGNRREQPLSGWFQLFQMMPVFLILFLSLFSTFIYPFLYSPPYQFYRTRSHLVKNTALLKPLGNWREMC
ncbi:DnaJ homolog subfamily B member 14 [Geodia barretti]|uniref:DnaJ homolog subfamily B member 14 n=1 Tax=Geodia barretti TaxID=519541 RepID=A0AA35X140_GEOBA|nr:DnaJ homolog subfamily B member 14 [Geodia barretti]